MKLLNIFSVIAVSGLFSMAVQAMAPQAEANAPQAEDNMVLIKRELYKGNVQPIKDLARDKKIVPDEVLAGLLFMAPDSSKEDKLYVAVEALLAAGANPNGMPEDVIPLLSAIFHKLPRVAELLLDKGANPTPDTKGLESPLQLAQEQKYTVLAEKIKAAIETRKAKA